MPNRRSFIAYLTAAVASTPALRASGAVQAETGSEAVSNTAAPLGFHGLPHGVDKHHHVAQGYSAEVLLRWGDVIVGTDDDSWNPPLLSRSEQERRFGYNNDFIAFMPLPWSAQSSTHGLLCVNHEYTNTNFMWPGLNANNIRKQMSADRTATEIAAIGHSIVEVRREDAGWRIVKGDFNRRITGFTRCALNGPVRGSDRVRTRREPQGLYAYGLLNACSGGKTPWGTVLAAEENFNFLFSGNSKDRRERANLKRYGFGKGRYYPWWADHFKQFKVADEPREPNGFGWVVEIDPYDPRSIPKKRTALGRFKHEAATCVINRDGRVVVYSGDDSTFEYLYRFVSRRPFDPEKRERNFDLLDEGELSVARFYDNGQLEWLPLTFGNGPLTPANGFLNQADVLVETRRAADLLEATRLDRPEDVEANPRDGAVYAMLTNNSARKPSSVDAANPRAANQFGHVLKLLAPGAPGPDVDHAATLFRWEVFLLAGNPEVSEHGAKYPAETEPGGWLASPDNCAFDPQGRLWIATDQGKHWRKTGFADGLWCYGNDANDRQRLRLFFRAPIGAEVCGPEFTPDGTTLFVAVQHPGVDGVTGAGYYTPGTRWPDFERDKPPRPSVVAITRKNGGEIGS